jgi:hypothetical protein
VKNLLIFLFLTVGFVGSFEGLHATEATKTSEIQLSECVAYYGEISAKTGRPKTKYVKGYYRKDGTYVEGYYRSV